MAHIRGNPADFDTWAYQGCYGWDYESVLPLFRRMEDVSAGDRRFRGTGGPLSPRPAGEPNPISSALVRAAREKGYCITDDFNGERFEGTGFHDLLIKDGRRQSAASAYLHPASSRPNVEVVTHAHVRRLLFAGDRCRGVQYEHQGRFEEVTAGAEVIVCAGAIDSPALLLRSGIGPADELARLGIDVVADVPEVGHNLHDHLLMGVLWEATQPVPPPAYNLGEASMFLRSRPDLYVPDLQFVFIHVPYHLPTFSAPEGSWTIGVGLVRPASRGRLKIATADPADRPLIDPAYLTARADVEAMLRGIELARDIASATVLDDWRRSLSPRGWDLPHGYRPRSSRRPSATRPGHPTAARRRRVRDARDRFGQYKRRGHDDRREGRRSHPRLRPRSGLAGTRRVRRLRQTI